MKMKNKFETLELGAIQKQLYHYTASTLAKSMIDRLSIYKDQ